MPLARNRSRADSTYLLISPPAQEREGWRAWSLEHGADPLACAPSPSVLTGPPGQWPRAKETVLVVPARKLSWHRTTLPQLARRRWEQALRGLLEEQFLEDPSRLHLALAPGTQAGQITWVAACEKAWLEGMVRTLREAGHRPDRIVPELEPSSDDEQNTYLWEEDGQVIWAQTGPGGVLVLPLTEPSPAEPGKVTLPPMSSPPWIEPQLIESTPTLWPGPALTLTRAARMQRAAQSQWELSQFGLNPDALLGWRSHWSERWMRLWRAPAWRPLRWGLAALVLTQALGLKAWTWRQAQLQEIGETEIARLLNETFPDLQALQDPIPMMQQRMAGLWANSAATAPTDLSALLYALAAAQAPAPRDIDYADGQLLLTPSDQAPLDRSSAWIQSLSAQGYLLEDTGGRWTIRPRNP